MTRFPLVKRLALLLAALAFPAAAGAKAPAKAQPAMWVVSDPDTTIYLFGTIHLLPRNMRWRSDSFDRAAYSSQELVVETIIDEKDPSKMIAALSSLAFTPGLPPLAERVSKDKRAKLQAAVAKSGFPPAALDGMETWAAAILLMGGQFRELDLEVSEGVESVLRSEFAGHRKPIGELETNAEQFGYFDRLPEKAQRVLLEGALEGKAEVKQVFDRMMNAWASGDVATIAKAFNEDLKDSPELSEHIILERNAAWAKWVEARLAKPGIVMVAVGAGHLAGPGSVIDLLQTKGLRARRVQ